MRQISLREQNNVEIVQKKNYKDIMLHHIQPNNEQNPYHIAKKIIKWQMFNNSRRKQTAFMYKK